MKKLKTKRRGISVVISSLLILAITIVGAVMISNMISASSISSISQTSKAEVASSSLILAAYDTRDGATLSSISSLNNEFDAVLCTDTCNSLSRDDIPANGGTDFIVIQLRNQNLFQLSINDIQVNGVTHIWDSQTAGVVFNANFDNTNGKYPLASKFSILPDSNLVSLEQQSIPNIEGGDEIRIVIKLNDNIQPDIGLGDAIHLVVNLGTSNPAEFFILAGDTR